MGWWAVVIVFLYAYWKPIVVVTTVLGGVFLVAGAAGIRRHRTALGVTLLGAGLLSIACPRVVEGVVRRGADYARRANEPGPPRAHVVGTSRLRSPRHLPELEDVSLSLEPAGEFLVKAARVPERRGSWSYEQSRRALVLVLSSGDEYARLWIAPNGKLLTQAWAEVGAEIENLTLEWKKLPEAPSVSSGALP